MEPHEFDPGEVIAGFPLVGIKRALTWVGVMEDRDDIKNVAKALGCPLGQAERVLEALERRGFVTKAPKKRQWETTPLGNRLHFEWKPPRRIQPAIEREDEGDANNEIFESVPCLILRPASDEGAALEECDIEVGLFVEYETDRVIEISVTQPDDYDHRDHSSTIESSVYLGVSDAKRFAAALQTAIGRAEAELARRATEKPRRKSRTRSKAPTVRAAPRSPSKKPPVVKSTKPSTTPRHAPAPTRSSSAKQEAPAESAKRQEEKRKKDDLAATLRELGHRP